MRLASLRLSWIALVVAWGLPVAAGATTLGFGCITNDSATDCGIGEAQLSVDVNDPGSGVEFLFHNVGSDAVKVEGVYFDDGTLLSIASITSGPGVSFSQGATPPELPGANQASPPFMTTQTFLADSDPSVSQNAVGPGEWLSVVFDLKSGGTFSDVLQDLTNGTLRVGVHAIAFASGGSESLVSLPLGVPEPGALALLGLAVASLTLRQRRR